MLVRQPEMVYLFVLRNYLAKLEGKIHEAVEKEEAEKLWSSLESTTLARRTIYFSRNASHFVFFVLCCCIMRLEGVVSVEAWKGHKAMECSYLSSQIHFLSIQQNF